MNEKLVIAVIEGTTRPKRESIKASRFVASIGERYPGVELVFVDPRDFTFPDDGNDDEGKDPRYTAITARADGFFIVTPEYNHSFPGSLKRMIDSEYEHYYHKAVAIAGVSNGGWGGTRAVEGLLPLLHTIGLVIAQHTPYFPRVQNIFDEQGAIHPDQADTYTKTVQAAWDELIWLARLLKAGRNAPSNDA
ncbi:MAG TPA: NAD(P)H-dependent oxidoreductase [Candidatus Saccharimonadales bacterium]|nr:NAD(P)H-dependent oxidoreductase [Candidatus Saccharimonadales bacterium]